MTILILAEHDGKQLSPATRSAVTAAVQMGGDIHIAVLGNGVEAIAQQAAKVAGVGKVLLAQGDALADGLAEAVVATLLPIAKNYSHILAPATTFGKDVLPRLAAKLDVMQISDIVGVVSADTFKRGIYAGNAIATVQSADSIKIITVRGTNFDRAPDGGNACPVEALAVASASASAKFVSRQVTESTRPELTSARVVVSGGRGMGNGENFAMLERIADKLGGAVGASRVAVDSGFVPNDYQVGQTGKVVAPDLYMAVGISGAIQHLAGMKGSKVIVAINKDENAPIFEVADYGIVGDLFQVLPELEKLL